MISFVINISLSLAKLTRSIFVSRNPPSTFCFLDCGKTSISIFPLKGFLHSPKGFHIPAQCILDSHVGVTISSPSGFRISPLGDGIPPHRISNSPWGDSSFLLCGFQVPLWEFQVSLGGLLISDSRAISKLKIPGSTRKTFLDFRIWISLHETRCLVLNL